MPEIDFRIILLNLLQNAFKAMSDNGKLHIDVKAVPAGKITINVTDNGHGISEENLKRIFDPFFTTDTANLPGSGSGLGLAIVKSIIDNCGGSIKAFLMTTGFSKSKTIRRPPPSTTPTRVELIRLFLDICRSIFGLTSTL